MSKLSIRGKAFKDDARVEVPENGEQMKKAPMPMEEVGNLSDATVAAQELRRKLRIKSSGNKIKDTGERYKLPKSISKKWE